MVIGMLLFCIVSYSFALSASDSPFNFNGEFNFRLRLNENNAGTSPGFQFYETEIFFDTQVNENIGLFLELPFMHANRPDIGNAWIDIHKPDELAATENTGLMIGNLMPFFGYFGYDDNQSYIFGGRTTTNTSLVRGTAIDSQIIRMRQIGVVANVKLGSFLIQPQLYNGSGMLILSGGSDNDRKLDFVSRLQYTLPQELGVIGTGYWNAPKTEGATANSGGTAYGGAGVTHVRDIERFALFFKYPDVMQATLPDLSLGGKPFMVYGEYIWGVHKGNPSITGFTADQRFLGYWLETNVNIVRDKLVAIFRYDYFNPNIDDSETYQIGLTPALKAQILKQTFLTLSYEYYGGGSTAAGKNNDRLTTELSIQF